MKLLQSSDLLLDNRLFCAHEKLPDSVADDFSCTTSFSFSSCSSLYEDASSPLVQLQDLPSDAINVILANLELADYRSLSQVSKTMSRFVAQATHLRSLRALGKTSLQQLLQKHKTITHLDLDGKGKIVDHIAPVLNASNAASTIRSLCLRSVVLTEAYQSHLVLPNLRDLSLIGPCKNATRLVVALSHLDSLSIQRFSTIRDEHVQLHVGRCQSLKRLKLQQCVRLLRPLLKFPHLESLSLFGCFALEDLPGIVCPSVTQLDLSFCLRIKSIQAVVDAIPQLEELTLVKCSALESLKIRSTQLRLLNVNYCNNLMALDLDCPNLEELHNTACFALISLRLSSESLPRLDLRSLPVEHLSINSSSLRRLSLEGCSKLKSCGIDCPRLTSVNVRRCQVTAISSCQCVFDLILNDWNHDITL